uniref:F-box/LRR-repeat protein 17-like n=1 Tax=Arvicanthis niloticus TaxID=61156 RepID=UPI0014862486|nr:F-box/LRR-repeat protein 17-like [Arvicanthis niloticus]
MGHLLSKEPRNRASQKKPRCCSWCRRRRPLIRLPGRTPTKSSPQPAAAAARNRDCFFRGPCMLCFIVHSPSGSAPAGPEEEPPLSPPLPRDGAYATAPLQHLEPRYAALAAEDCAAAARRFLLSSAAAAASSSASSPSTRCKELGLAAAAAWEQQGRSLFVASMGPLRFLGPPAAVQLFQGLPPQNEHPLAPDLVCDWKDDDEPPEYTYCSQPRCGGGGGGGGSGGPVGGGGLLLQPRDAGYRQAPEQPIPVIGSRPTSPVSECSFIEATGDTLRAGSITAWASPHHAESRKADCQRLPDPCSFLRDSPPEPLDINQLPGSIVLEVDMDD